MAAILKKGGTVKGKLPSKKTGVASKPKNTTNKAPLKRAASPGQKDTTAKVAVERNEFGIAVDSDQARVLAQMIEGGEDKHSVIVRCDEMFNGETTSGGKPKPSSTIMNQLIRNLTERGFKVEASWRFVPPENGLTPAVRKVRASNAKKTTGTSPAVATAKKVLGKLPAKKPSSGERKLAESAGIVKPTKTVAKLPAKRSKVSS